MTKACEKTPVILPVRRRLMAAALAYLGGIFLAAQMALPGNILILLCVLFTAWAVLRLRSRKRALFCILMLMLCLGNLRAGDALRLRDTPTASGVWIEGTVKAILKPYRVQLTDVTVNGKAAAARDVVLTLMQEEAEETEGTEEAEVVLLAAEPLIGQRVAGTGRLFAPDEPRNPGGIDWRIQAICNGYELSGYLLPGWTADGDAVFSIWAWFRQMRLALIERITLLFGEQAALFQGILLGDRSALDDEVTAAMRLTGTAHILTVSGLHLSMAAHVISRLLERAPLKRRSRFALLSAFLMGFTMLTGAAAGTVRACIMAMLREYALVRGRRYEPLTSLACAALLMTLVNPLWALNASFQFSFFVVLGILLFAGSFTDFVNRRVQAHGRVKAVLGTAAVSASAQIASVPMQLLLYGYVPVLSLPMNLLCGALMPVLMLGGWGITLLGLLWPKAAMLPANLLGKVAVGFEALSLRAAEMTGAIVRMAAPYGATVLLFAIVMLLLSNRIRLGRWRRQTAALLACAVLLSYLTRLNPQARYVQLDVGQGDAALFRKGRRAVLVDVGPAESYEMLRYLRHEGLYVDAVILSHLDEDHAGALGVLLSSEMEIPTVVTAAQAYGEEPVSLVVIGALETIREEQIPLAEVKRGDRIAANGVTMDVLSPDETLTGSNERSLLLHAQAEGVSFLLTGDLMQESEPEDVPAVQVLKVAHHGSKNSSSDEFLEKVRPELALISVGAGNRYGHPGWRVLDALEAIDADVLRTDRCGCITLWLENGTYRAQTYLTE